MDDPANRWKLPGSTLDLGPRTLVMGILNVTPDSFSDGGRFDQPRQAVARAHAMADEGADIIDVGAESTRPGSTAVDAQEEVRRLTPVLEGLDGTLNVPLSVDTKKAQVARFALDHGAAVVNDVSALADPAMASLVAEFGAGLVLMHSQGDPATMQRQPTYADVSTEVAGFLRLRAEAAISAGVHRDAVAVDPGLGFGKRTGHGVEDNVTLLARLGQVTALGYPVVVGASRKSFIGNVTQAPVHERLAGSLGAAALAAYNGAHIVRVHDIAPTRQALALVDAVKRESVAPPR